jgi:hypothetical protein
MVDALNRLSVANVERSLEIDGDVKGATDVGPVRVTDVDIGQDRVAQSVEVGPDRVTEDSLAALIKPLLMHFVVFITHPRAI